MQLFIKWENIVNQNKQSNKTFKYYQNYWSTLCCKKDKSYRNQSFGLLHWVPSKVSKFCFMEDINTKFFY